MPESILARIDDVMYFPILIIVMTLAGLYFTLLTRGVQIRLFRESCRLVAEPTEESGKVSSFQALMVSTASRVGTGNIIGVTTARRRRDQRAEGLREAEKGGEESGLQRGGYRS